MRKPIIAGNWKMNMTPSEGVALVESLKPLVEDAACEVVVCPPAICLPAVAKAIEGSNIALGAQNMHWEPKGAYTGEIAAGMLCEVGVQYVIIGHSERRAYFAETNETVNKKVRAAIAAGLTPIMCCGETLELRESGGTDAFVAQQIREGLQDLTADQVAALVIAYEPIWAIGTGRTATNDQAQETIAMIRATVADVFGAQAADAVRIQYGGSMNPKNASDLMAMPDIDGGLIGGASLNAADFAKVVHFDK